MIRLFYNGLIRAETDDQTISLLIKKGWIPVLNEPVYNEETERISYETQTNSWVIEKISDEEIGAKKDFKEAFEKYKLFTAKVNEGFGVQPENIILALGESDRNAFSQMLGLVKEALDLGIINGETPQIISDKNGQKYQITTNRFRQIMVQYGFYFKTLWDQLDS